jgi:hypothetical protein
MVFALVLTGAALVPLAAAALLWLRHRRSWTLALLSVTTALFCIFVVAVVLITTDYRDADGFIDCWPHCSAFQDAVRWAFLLGGALVLLGGLIALIALLAVEVRRLMRRHDDRRRLT